MPRKCTVCAHKQTEQINKELAANRSYRVIASQFSITQGAVGRHAINCVADAIDKAREAQVIQNAIVTEDEASKLYNNVMELLHATQDKLRDEAGNISLSASPVAIDQAKLLLAATKEARGVLETVAKLRGEFAKPKENPNSIQDKIDYLVKEFGYTHESAILQLQDWGETIH